MRKDVILGMSIGGVVLAVVIVYLTIAPSGKANKHQAQLDGTGYSEPAGGAGDVAGGAGDIPETPVTPAAPTDVKPAKPADKSADKSADKDHGKSASPRKDDAAKTFASGDAVGAPVRPVILNQPDDTHKTPGADGDKPQVLVATSVEKSDAKWGERLWGKQTPLIGVSETPDPNAATAAALEAAGDQSAVSKRRPIVVPNGPETVGPKPPAPNPVQAKAGPRQHTVADRETFSTIAQAVYGSASYYPAILRANPQIDPRKLKAGMVINLPDPAEVKPAESDKAATPAAGATVATPVARKIEASTVDPKSEYRVQAGDSLNKIATKLYGRIDMVQKIYDANKTAIGADPAKLKLGMVLKLPEAPTATAGR